jgi:hypothetical protein
MRVFRLPTALSVVAFSVLVVAAAAAGAPSTWVLVPSPNPGARANVLYSVSCTAPRSCVAVGAQTDSLNTSGRTLVETWNGTIWTVAPSPSLFVSGVSCTSPKSCVAVGSYSTDRLSGGRTLVERWDGSTWNMVPSPNPNVPFDTGDPPASYLAAVSCATPRSCVAVGAHFFNLCTYGLGQTLTEVWDGTTWTIVPSPNPDTSSCDAFTILQGVSCPRPDACVAVGYTQDKGNGTSRTVTETWDGHAWTLVPSPNPPGVMTDFRDPPLTAVTCATPTSCFAVGELHDGSNGTQQTLIEHWDGRAWTIVPSPNPSTYRRPSNALTGVSCATPTSCSAVGSYDDADGFAKTLVEIWDGTAWTVRPSPTPGIGGSLNGVSCPTPTSCIAVGATGTADAVGQTLVLSGSTAPSSRGR